MSSQKLVIFDLDGTLINTVALVVEAVTAAFEGVGQQAPDEKTIRSVSGLGIGVGMRILAPDADEDLRAQISTTYRQHYVNLAAKSRREALFPGAMELLNALAARDDLFLAVATGKPLAGTKRVLAAHNITGLFTSLQTPDNNLSKPNPEMIFTAMGVVDADKTKTVMIGDTNHDMEMAVAAGVASIGVGWGYHLTGDLKEAGADVIAQEFAALAGAIDQLIGS